jgi:hypothetical protein
MIQPDVAYAASQLSHHLTNPGAAHFKAAAQVIAYLYRTKHLGISASIISGIYCAALWRPNYLEGSQASNGNYLNY